MAEEGWAGVSDARQQDAAGTDAEGFRGAVDGRELDDPTHRDEAAMNGAPKIMGGPLAT